MGLASLRPGFRLPRSRRSSGLVGQELLLVRFLNEYQVRGQADLTKGVLLSSLKISSVAMLIAIGAVAIGARSCEAIGGC